MFGLVWLTLVWFRFCFLFGFVLASFFYFCSEGSNGYREMLSAFHAAGLEA